MVTPLKLMVVAAEASGDTLGAGLIRELQAQSAVPLTFFGVGGKQMAELGIESPFDIAQLSILGMVEGLKAYKRVKARVADTVALAQRETPDAVILIDSWGFTLRVAHGIRAVMPDVALIKYVGPQVWATRPGRAKTLAQSVDLLLALHPMDAPYFEKEGLETVVVGNPALNVDFTQADPDGFRARHDLGDRPFVLVLPGSRPSEIRRLMPTFRGTLERLAAEQPDLKFVMPVADTVRGLVHEGLDGLTVPLILIEAEADKLSAMKAATVALACSGTVSTELALAGCPMVIAYKVEPLTFFIFKHISPLDHVTLFNIMAGKTVAPEFIQNDCTVDALTAAVAARLDDPALRDRQREEQFAALDLMGRGQPAPAKLAAAAVLDHLNVNPKITI
ncbi:lipid-A-disaccharide synthase [Asticcacaulis sp. BYS171W]|uniref:Lipid-A-disaccharide synthase n=1 Tax=Asticcacaulis aquaticus TaxID=2984212 RepID=A0ABT5HP68_9CAUL|nr:lipid-A-disaccharide synthase [Asticcacaulis aquaticus]MDC7681850.1 lipid-A-disaccharide synthase [Asticcacaulis aquaticus]